MALASTSLAIKAPLVEKDNFSLVKKTKQREVSVHLRAMNVMAPTKDKLDGSEAYTLYVIIATCPETKSWWLFHKRYSQFFALRKELTHLYRKCKSSALLKPLASLLDRTITMEFPRKHIMLTFENPVVIQERKQLLTLFTASLITLRSQCIYAAMDEKKNSNPVLFDKLISVCQLISSFLNAPQHVGHRNYIETRDETSLDCPICLEPRNSSSVQSLVMPCGHSFHEECLIKWFESDMSCPLCRARANQGAIL